MAEQPKTTDGGTMTTEQVIKDILDWADELDINHTSLDNARKFLEHEHTI